MEHATIVTCPQCSGAKYIDGGDRCPLCQAKGSVEDGGPSIVYGDKALRATPYIGESGFPIVLNLPR